jgi:fumarylacetoacetate (FAA) hydrolase
VSNYDANKVGSACIVERRALDTMAGRALTPYLKADDLVELTCRDAGGQAIFGELRQRVVRHP